MEDVAIGKDDVVRHLVVTIHGIRTHGPWQGRFEAMVQKAIEQGTGLPDGKLEFVHRRYGFFSVIAFFIPLLRWFQARRFRRELEHLIDRHPGLERLDVFAHSFGTYVATHAIAGRPHRRDLPRVDNLVLAGSVLPTSYPWEEVLGRHVARVVNECGLRDGVLFLNRLVIPLLGAAGLLGFRTLEHRDCVQRYFNVDHGGYFEAQGSGRDHDWFLRRYWLPIVVGPARGQVEAFDARGPLSAVEGVRLFLLNNATVLKLAALGLVVAGIVLWIGGLYVNAEMQRQLAVARLAASEAERVAAVSPSRVSDDTNLLAVEALKRLPQAERPEFVRRNALRHAGFLASLRLSISHVKISEDGKAAAMAWGNNVALFDLAGDKRLAPISIQKAEVVGLGLDPTGSIMMVNGYTGFFERAGGVDAAFYVFRIGEPEPIHSLGTYSTGFAASPAGRTVAYTSTAGGVGILNPVTAGVMEVAILTEEEAIAADSLSPDFGFTPSVPPADGSSLSQMGFVAEDRIVAIDRGKLGLIDAGSGALLAKAAAPGTWLRVAPTGRYFAIRADDPLPRTVKVFDTSGDKLEVLHELGSDTSTFVFSPDGRKLYWTNDAEEPRVSELDLATGHVEIVCELYEVAESLQEGGFDVILSELPSVTSITLSPSGEHGIMLTDSSHRALRILALVPLSRDCRRITETNLDQYQASFVTDTLAVIEGQENSVMILDAAERSVVTQNPLDRIQHLAAAPRVGRMVFEQDGVAKWAAYSIEGMVFALCRGGDRSISADVWERVFGDEPIRPTCEAGAR